MSQASNDSSSYFSDLLAAGSIDDAKIWLRSLIYAEENSLENPDSETLNIPDFDTYDLHDQLNPNGVSLSLFFEDYAENQDALAQIISQLAINGQDDIKLLLALSSKRITTSQFFQQQVAALRLNYGLSSETHVSSDRSPYTPGFANVMMSSDLLESLQQSDHDHLKQLVYDYTSRSWGHSFPDFDFFCQQLSKHSKDIVNGAFANANSSIPNRDHSKYYVRLGLPSLFDVVLSAFFSARESSPCLQLYSFSSIEILQALARSLPYSDNNNGEGLSALQKFIARMNVKQVTTLISKVHFGDLFPAGVTILDLSASVIENIEAYSVFGSTYTFIVPPFSLNQHSSLFWACGTYLRHYPLPFLGEDQALKDVLESLHQFSSLFKDLPHLRIVHVPENIFELSASEAFRMFQDLFGCDDSPSSRTPFFDQAWQCLQQAMTL